jgi:hypothetical protein
MHLSYSQISMYVDCGKRWQGHYRQNLRSPLGEALIFGSVVHSVIEKFIVDKKINMQEQFHNDWNTAVALPANKSIVWEETPDTAKAAGDRIFSSQEVFDVLSAIVPGKYSRESKEQPGQFETVDAVEREIFWHLKDVPDIVGYIDCIADDGVPIDFKTAGRMWSADKARKEMQPLFYLAALEELGEHSHGFKFRHIVITKSATPRIEIFEEQRSPVEIETMEMIVRAAWSGISSGLFIPNPTSMLCDPRFCGAYFDCVGKNR